MTQHGILWKEKLLYFKQIPPKFSSYFGNFVGMTRFAKSEGKCGEDTVEYLKHVFAAFALNA